MSIVGMSELNPAEIPDFFGAGYRAEIGYLAV